MTGADLTWQPSATRAGMGLRGMEERVAQLGAHLTIDSQAGQGTKIKVEVQL